MDIVVWLRSLGLGQYEAVFRQNDIDETVLPNLTAEDLKGRAARYVQNEELQRRLVSDEPMSQPECLSVLVAQFLYRPYTAAASMENPNEYPVPARRSETPS